MFSTNSAMYELKFCPDTKILVIEEKWKSSKKNPKVWGNFSEKIPCEIFDKNEKTKSIRASKYRYLSKYINDIYLGAKY